MDDLQLVRARLAKTPVAALYALSKASEIPYGTLWNLKKKKTKKPQYETVKKLADHFRLGVA
jgi:hypothetical protein